MFYCICFLLPSYLRARLVDCGEILHSSRKLAGFRNAGPKIWDPLQKNLGAKNMQNLVQFWTTSNFDAEYLENR